jgi:uncharacterized membrane protein
VTEMPAAEIPTLITQLKPNDQAVVAVKIQIPKDAKPGSYKFDCIQREDRTNRVIGGVAIEIRVSKGAGF